VAQALVELVSETKSYRIQTDDAGIYQFADLPMGEYTLTFTREWFTTLTEPDGNTYLLVTKILEDSQYMSAPYIRTVQFKKETGAAGWNPVPCT